MENKQLSILSFIIFILITSLCYGDKANDSPTVPLTEKQIKLVKPVLERLAEAIGKIASKYPEMSEYKTEKVIKQSNLNNISLGYSHNFTAPNAKRAVVPSDFGEKGFYLSFVCMPHPRSGTAYAMAPPWLSLNNLKMYVWIGIGSAPNPSSGLIDEINKAINLFTIELKNIDEKSEENSKKTNKVSNH